MENLTGAEKLAQNRRSGAPDEKDYRSLASGELADAWDLGEFFEALGPVMRLPPKDASTPEPRRLLAGPAPGRRTVALVWVAIALVAVAASAPLVQTLRAGEPVPPGLRGVWTTTAERYAGRSFELSETSLRLGLGALEATYPIGGMRSRDSSTAAIYTIQYRDGESPLEFAVAIGPDSVARIRNMPDVGWRKMVR